MNKILFTDLDRTLIYSAKQVKKYGNSFTDLVVVEKKNDKPLSYMRSDVWEKLKNGKAEYHNNKIVPVTTRTWEQYSRISLPFKHEDAIILNGGRIFINGEEIIEWNKKLKEQIGSLITSTFTWLEQYLNTPSFKVEHVKQADGLFIYVTAPKTNTSEQVNSLEDVLVDICAEKELNLSRQDTKFYLLPPFLSKGEAVHEYCRITGFEGYSMATGDTVLDYSMAEYVDLFIRPAHADHLTIFPSNMIDTIHKGVDSFLTTITLFDKV